MASQDAVEQTAPQQVCVEFDSRAFSIETLQKAALKFTRIASFDFRIGSEHQLQVTVRTIGGVALNVGQFSDAYRNEVLDQHLRVIVARETEVERNLILAYAFSNTKLVTP